MSDNKSKNILQEYFQIRHLPLPKYQTIKCGGSDHQPLWHSTITFWNNQTNEYQDIIGDIAGTKVKAEISAAHTVLCALNQHNTSPLRSCSAPLVSFQNSNKKMRVNDRTALFVDVENLPKFAEEAAANIDNITIYAFVGYHHCLSEKVFPDNIIKVLSPSTRSDGSDTCMQIYIGVLLSQNKYDTYLIATRDHYGSALVDMITSDTLLWSKKEARVVTQLSHI